jgi:hypothetical protein
MKGWERSYQLLLRDSSEVSRLFTEDDLSELGEFSLSKKHVALRAQRHLSSRLRGMPPVVVEPAFAIAAAAVMFGVSAIAAALERRFGPPSLTRDIRQLLNRRGEYPARPVPLLRDYAFLAIIGLTALSYAHFARQWRRIESLPRLLAEGGLLRTDSKITSASFCEWFSKLQLTSCRLRWELWSGFVAATITVALVWAALHRGIYPLLDRGDDVSAFHLSQWWARPENGFAGTMTVALIVFLFFFITVRHTIMGGHILLWLAAMRSASSVAGRRDWFGYSDPWAAPEEALDELRRAIFDVFLAILLGACAAAAAVYVIAVPPELIVLLIGYLIYNLIVFILPWVYFNRQLVRSKYRLQARLLGELRQAATSSEQPNARDALWLSYRRTTELPSRVIARLPIGALVALYLIPVVGIIPAYR